MKQLLLGVIVCAVALTGSTFAQFETFDCGTPGTTGCTTTGTGFPYNGWTNDPGDINTSFRLDGGGTASVNTGPSDDLTGGGLYVYLETSCGDNPNVGFLVSPVFDATGVVTPTLRFSYHMFGVAMGTLSVEESDGMGGWTTIWTLSGDRGDTWFTQEVGVSTYPGPGGPEARIRFVGIRGASFTSDMAIDNVKFGEPGPPPPPPSPIHQDNLPTASLDIDGFVCFEMCPGVFPDYRAHENGDLMNWTISSGPSGRQPYALFITPSVGANFTSPGISTPVGIIDFRTSGLAVLEAIIDGITGTSVVDMLLGDTTDSGTRTLEFTMPAGVSGSTLLTVKGITVDPGSPFGIQLTRATQIDRRDEMPIPPLDSAFTGTAPLAMPLGDDDTQQFVFGSSFTFPFYGIHYPACWINSNGSISFGLGGDTDPTESVFDLENEEARIAGWWDDLDPSVGGNIATTHTSSQFLVSFVDVPEFGVGATNTVSFGIDLRSSGDISIGYGGVANADGLVGISPGNNRSVGPLNPGVSQDLANAARGSISGAVNDSIFNLFTTNPGYGYQSTPCHGLITGRLVLNFIPNAPLLVPGDSGYSAP